MLASRLSNGETIMPTRNVVLTDHHDALVGKLVDSGRYQNASEVLREGLRLVERREDEYAARLNALREAADMGMRDIDEGRFDVVGTPGEVSAYLRSLAADPVR
jgi:antitoxin ParD1/3/4